VCPQLSAHGHAAPAVTDRETTACRPGSADRSPLTVAVATHAALRERLDGTGVLGTLRAQVRGEIFNALDASNVRCSPFCPGGMRGPLRTSARRQDRHSVGMLLS
jgi:hypothetical protein